MDDASEDAWEDNGPAAQGPVASAEALASAALSLGGGWEAKPGKPPIPGGRSSDGLASERKVISDCADQARACLEEAAILADAKLIRRSDVEEVVQESTAKIRGCVMMVLTVVFLVTYTVSAHMHEDIVKGYLTQVPLQEKLSEGFEEVLTINDVWTWIENVYVPTFFKQTDMYGESLPEEEWSRVLNYNQLQGAVRLVQARSPKAKCKDDIAAHLNCFPQGEMSTEPFGKPIDSIPADLRSVIESDDEGFAVQPLPDGRRLRDSREEMLRYMPAGGVDSDTFRFFLHKRSPLDHIKKRVQYLRSRWWLDEQTRWVKLQALVLNQEQGRPSTSKLEVTFFFSRGGGVFANMYFQAVFLESFKDSMSMAADGLYLLVLLVFTAFMIHSLCVAVRRRQVYAHFCNLADFLAWVNVVLSWLNVSCFAILESYRAEFKALLETLHSAQGDDYRQAEESVHEASMAMWIFTSWFHTLSTYLVLLLMARSFIALGFQPRLAIVLKTLKVSSIDLLHFLIVMIPTFVAYGIGGMCIFGRRVEEFSTLERALGTCFKIAIESEFEWVKLSAEDTWTAAMWVWTYILLIVMIMLNMVLAIIMDVYAEVRSHSAQSETVGESIIFFSKRVWWWRQWVSLHNIAADVQGLPQVFVADELEQVLPPKMPSWQFDWLVAAARSKVQNAGWNDEQLRTRMLAAMNVGSDMAAKSLGRLVNKRSAEARAEDSKKVRRRSDETCYEDMIQSMAVQTHWMMSVQEQLDQIRSLQRFSNAMPPPLA